MGSDLVDVAHVAPQRVVHRHGQDLVVRALLVAHLEHPYGLGVQQAARERGLLDQHEDVHLVAVLRERARDVTVVGRVVDRTEQDPVQLDLPALVVVLVLVTAALGHLDDHFHDPGELLLHHLFGPLRRYTFPGARYRDLAYYCAICRTIMEVQAAGGGGR